jgi:DNA-binding NtrC family response regulator
MALAKSVLIAGIDKMDGNFLCEMLGELGHHPIWVSSWDKAQRLLNQAHFDLLFLDELLEDRRKEAPLAWLMRRENQIPVIIMTGEIQEAKEITFCACRKLIILNKPFQENSILHALSRLL